jgi:glucokinase
MYRVGIDLGGTNIAVGLVNERHDIVADISVPTGAERPAGEISADMCSAVDAVLKKADATVSDCAMIGVGAPASATWKAAS